MKFSTETVIEIWNDDNGEKVTVGPDRDGLGLLEVRSYDSAGVVDGHLTFPLEQAELVGNALVKLAIDKGK